MKNRKKDTKRFEKKFSKCLWKKHYLYEEKFIKEKESKYLKKNGLRAFLPKQIMNLLGSKIIRDLKVDLEKKECTEMYQDCDIYQKYQKQFQIKSRKLGKMLKNEPLSSPSYTVLSKAKRLIFSKSSSSPNFLKISKMLRDKSKKKGKKPTIINLLGIYTRENIDSQNKNQKFLNISKSTFFPLKNKTLSQSKFKIRNPKRPRKRTQKKSFRSKTQRFHSQTDTSVNLKYLFQNQRSNFFLTELSKSNTIFYLYQDENFKTNNQSHFGKTHSKPKIKSLLNSILQNEPKIMHPRFRLKKESQTTSLFDNSPTHLRIENPIPKRLSFFNSTKSTQKINARLYNFDPLVQQKMKNAKAQLKFRQSMNVLNRLCLQGSSLRDSSHFCFDEKEKKLSPKNILIPVLRDRKSVV